MAGFEDLFADPMAAIGYSLLLPQNVNGNPMASAASLLQLGSEAKRERERKDKQSELADLELKYKMQQLTAPDLQFNPVTGEVYDMKKGAPYATMPGQGAQVSAGGDSQPVMPPAPSGLNPKEQMEWRKNQISAMTPNPPKDMRLTAAGEYEPIPGSELHKQRQKASQFKGDTKRLIDDLLRDPESLRAITGTVDSMFPTIMPRSAEAQVKLNQLRDMLTTENLGLMTGVLSETDLQVLRNVAGGGLAQNRSDAGLIAELQRIQQQLGGQLGDPNQAAAMQGGGYKAPAAGQIKFLGFE